MTLPEPLRLEVDAAIREEFDDTARIVDADPVGGGCISPVARLSTAGGERYFLKWTTADHPSGLLEAEARGLRRLADSDTVRVPRVLAQSQGQGVRLTDPAISGTDHRTEWLLLEWLEPGPTDPAGWERLGRDLAALHQHRASSFGAEADNFIGTLPQANGPGSSWPEFWRSRRLEPQLRMAIDRGHFDDTDRGRFQRLFQDLDGVLSQGDTDGPSTLHGDLWGGNVHFTAAGTPALVDPSVYHGHREVDLAMAELFGGFGPAFGAAYREAWPLAHGYVPARRAIYQLYYLLVHVNLFGSGYVVGCRGALRDAGH